MVGPPIAARLCHLYFLYPLPAPSPLQASRQRAVDFSMLEDLRDMEAHIGLATDEYSIYTYIAGCLTCKCVHRPMNETQWGRGRGAPFQLCRLVVCGTSPCGCGSAACGAPQECWLPLRHSPAALPASQPPHAPAHHDKTPCQSCTGTHGISCSCVTLCTALI